MQSFASKARSQTMQIRILPLESGKCATSDTKNADDEEGEQLDI